MGISKDKENILKRKEKKCEEVLKLADEHLYTIATMNKRKNTYFGHMVRVGAYVIVMFLCICLISSKWSKPPQKVDSKQLLMCQIAVGVLVVFCATLSMWYTSRNIQ